MAQPVDFIGLNTFIYQVSGWNPDVEIKGKYYQSIEYITPTKSVSLLQNHVGFPASRILEKNVHISLYRNWTWSRTNEQLPNWPTYSVALLLKRNGPYGWPTWKQIRTAEDSLFRKQRRHNIFTYVEQPGSLIDKTDSFGKRILKQNRRSDIRTVYEQPISSKYKPLELGGTAAPDDQDFGQCNDIDFKIKSSHGNEINFFDNNDVAKYYDRDPETSENYENIKSLYLNGSLDSESSPLEKFQYLKYSETVYPSVGNVFRNHIRTRVKYDFKWSSDIHGRIEPGISHRPRAIELDKGFLHSKYWPRETTPPYTPKAIGWGKIDNGFKFVVPFQSKWNLDAGWNYSIWHSNRDSIFIPGVSQFDDFQRIAGTRKSIASSSAYIQPIGGAGLYNGTTNPYNYNTDNGTSGNPTDEAGGQGLLQNSYCMFADFRQVSSSAGFVKNIDLVFSAGACYSRRHVIPSPYALVAASGMFIQEIDDAITNGNLISIYESFGGETKWQVGETRKIYDSSGNLVDSPLEPFYETYDKYAENIRIVGKDYTIVPEFRISDHVMRYEKIGPTEPNLDLFSVIGAPEDFDNSSDARFYKIYSNTDFMEHFRVIKHEHKDFVEPSSISLECKAIKKFLPYDGFYPSQRTEALAKQFVDSYSKHFETIDCSIYEADDPSDVLPVPAKIELKFLGEVFSSASDGHMKTPGLPSFTYTPLGSYIPSNQQSTNCHLNFPPHFSNWQTHHPTPTTNTIATAIMLANPFDSGRYHSRGKLSPSIFNCPEKTVGREPYENYFGPSAAWFCNTIGTNPEIGSPKATPSTSKAWSTDDQISKERQWFAFGNGWSARGDTVTPVHNGPKWFMYQSNALDHWEQSVYSTIILNDVNNNYVAFILIGPDYWDQGGILPDASDTENYTWTLDTWSGPDFTLNYDTTSKVKRDYFFPAGSHAVISKKDGTDQTESHHKPDGVSKALFWHRNNCGKDSNSATLCTQTFPPHPESSNPHCGTIFWNDITTHEAIKEIEQRSQWDPTGAYSTTRPHMSTFSMPMVLIRAGNAFETAQAMANAINEIHGATAGDGSRASAVHNYWKAMTDESGWPAGYASGFEIRADVPVLSDGVSWPGAPSTKDYNFNLRITSTDDQFMASKAQLLAPASLSTGVVLSTSDTEGNFIPPSDGFTPGKDVDIEIDVYANYHIDDPNYDPTYPQTLSSQVGVQSGTNDVKNLAILLKTVDGKSPCILEGAHWAKCNVPESYWNGNWTNLQTPYSLGEWSEPKTDQIDIDNITVCDDNLYTKIQPMITPLFAPGVLYNTIKSGIACDYPLMTENIRRVLGEVPSKDEGNVAFWMIGARLNSTSAFIDEGNDALPYLSNTGSTVTLPNGYSMVNYNIFNDPDLNAATGSSGSAIYDILSIKRNIYNYAFRGFNLRIPFESLIEPENYLSNTTFINQEPDNFLYFGKYVRLSYKTRWDGNGDLLYKKMAHNFLAEIPDFFLKSGKMKRINSLEQGNPNFGNVEAIEIAPGHSIIPAYKMRVKMYRSMDSPRRSILANGVRLTPPQDVIFPARGNNPRETITMYSRPSAFGPPSWGGDYKAGQKTKGKGHKPKGPSVSLDSRYGYNFPFTPPYYHGEAWADITFRPSRAGKHTLDEIMGNCTVKYYRYWAPDSNLDIERISKGSELSYTDWTKSLAHSGSDYNNYYAPQHPLFVNDNAMQLDSSLNLFSREDVDITKKLTGPALATGVNYVETKDQNRARWVIQPKFETPILNFQHLTAKSGIPQISSIRFDPPLYSHGKSHALPDITTGGSSFTKCNNNYHDRMVTFFDGLTRYDLYFSDGQEPYVLDAIPDPIMNCADLDPATQSSSSAINTLKVDLSGLINNTNFSLRDVALAAFYRLQQGNILCSFEEITQQANQGLASGAQMSYKIHITSSVNGPTENITTEIAEKYITVATEQYGLLDNSSTTNAKIDLSKHSPLATTRGMWHQYGTIPSGDEGIFIRIEDIPQSWTKGALGIHKNRSQYTGSLADLVGFSKEPLRLGELANTKTISEAVVAIPFVEERGERKFFEIPRRDIENAMNPKPAVRMVGPSIRDMVKKMQRFVLPPSMDFIINSDITPFAMYIFEFKHVLTRQDLSDIWQGLPPQIGRSYEKTSSTITHKLLSSELLGGGTSVSKDNAPHSANTDQGLPLSDRLRWMVFKAKRRAKINYYDKVVKKEGVSDEDIDIKASRVTYNWPYDFFSLVELVKIDASVTFADMDIEKIKPIKTKLIFNKKDIIEDKETKVIKDDCEHVVVGKDE